MANVEHSAIDVDNLHVQVRFVQAGAPVSFNDGDTWLDTDDNRFHVAVASAWVEVSADVESHAHVAADVTDFDDSAAAVVVDTVLNGTGLTATMGFGPDTIELGLDNTYITELIRDTIGTALVEGTGIDITISDVGNTITIDASAPGAHTHPHTDITDWDEAVQDTVGAAIVAGNNIDVTYSDGAGTITIDVETLTSADLTDFATAVDERARDALGTALTAGTGISIAVDDALDTITITATGAVVGTHTHPHGDITDWDEAVQDTVGAAIVAGNNIDVTYSDGAGTITIDVETLTSADISDWAEAVQDTVGAAIVAGNNIDVTYNDGAGTITIDVESLTSVDVTDFTEAAQDAVGAILVNGTGVDLTYSDATPSITAALTAAARTSTLNFVIDGGGSVIATGIKGDLVVDFAGSINRVTALADQSGSIQVDIWKDSYANFPPVDADSITASAPVVISSATKSQDSTLTGWTTSFSAGDVLRFNVDSVTSITRCTIALRVVRS